MLDAERLNQIRCPTKLHQTSSQLSDVTLSEKEKSALIEEFVKAAKTTGIDPAATNMLEFVERMWLQEGLKPLPVSVQ